MFSYKVLTDRLSSFLNNFSRFWIVMFGYENFSAVLTLIMVVSFNYYLYNNLIYSVCVSFSFIVITRTTLTREQYGVSWKTFATPLKKLNQDQRFFVYWNILSLIILCTGSHLKDSPVLDLSSVQYAFGLVMVVLGFCFFIRSLVLAAQSGLGDVRYDFILTLCLMLPLIFII